MSATDIYDAFAVMAGEFAKDNNLPISYPAVHFVPPNTGEWLELIAFWNGSENYAVQSDAPYIESGFFRIVVCSRSQGLMTAQRIADKAVKYFPKGTVFSAASVEEMPSIGSPLQEPDKIIVPVTVSWRASSKP